MPSPVPAREAYSLREGVCPEEVSYACSTSSEGAVVGAMLTHP